MATRPRAQDTDDVLGIAAARQLTSEDSSAETADIAETVNLASTLSQAAHDQTQAVIDRLRGTEGVPADDGGLSADLGADLSVVDDFVPLVPVDEGERLERLPDADDDLGGDDG